MSIEDKCHKLAEEVVAGLNIRSARIRDEVTSDLANSIESDIDDALDLAGYRIEDYEEGARAGVVTPSRSARWYDLWRRAFG